MMSALKVYSLLGNSNIGHLWVGFQFTMKNILGLWGKDACQLIQASPEARALVRKKPKCYADSPTLFGGHGLGRVPKVCPGHQAPRSKCCLSIGFSSLEGGSHL